MIGPSRVGAAAQVVTLAEAKAHLRVDHSDEDSLITSLLAAATAMVSDMTGLVLGAEVWSFQVPVPLRDLAVPVVPVTALSAVAYLDADEVVQSANPADFLLIADARRPLIRPKTGSVWPAFVVREDALRVTVAAGLTALPPELRVAILMLLGHWYANRASVAGGDLREVPQAVTLLVEPYRTLWIAA